MDDSGAAYTFAMVIVLIFVAALAYAFLIPSVNKIGGQMNNQIMAGEISEQTKEVYDWNINFFIWSLAIGLLGFTVFAIVRAIEVSEAGGGLFG